MTEMLQTATGELKAGRERVILRAMQTDDLQQVAAIEADSFSAPWPVASFRNELELRGVSEPVVGVHEGRVVGYIIPWFIADELQIISVAVQKKFRNRGIGRLLLSHVLDLARQRRCRVVYLEVRRSNGVAHHLYRSLGFVPDGVRSKYYDRENEDAIIMKKELFHIISH